jgi:hypothetical protein
MGIIGQTLAWTFAIIGVELSLIATWMLCRALWPRRVERAAERCAKRPVVSFVIGLPLVVGTVFVAGKLAQLAGSPGSIAALLILTVGYFYTSVGMAGVATHIGRRLESPVDDLRPWRPTLRGGIVLTLCYLMPFVGWFGVTLISILIGTGANTLSFFSRRKAVNPPPLDDALSARMAAGADFGTVRHSTEEALR